METKWLIRIVAKLFAKLEEEPDVVRNKRCHEKRVKKMLAVFASRKASVISPYRSFFIVLLSEATLSFSIICSSSLSYSESSIPLLPVFLAYHFHLDHISRLEVPLGISGLLSPSVTSSSLVSMRFQDSLPMQSKVSAARCDMLPPIRFHSFACRTYISDVASNLSQCFF